MAWTYFDKVRDYDNATKWFEASIQFPHPEFIERMIAHAYERMPDLDKALDHAQRAVELEPQAGNIDTLAEVYFRRGNRAEALRLARRCLEMEPDGEHYKKQLARFERP